MHEDGGMLDDPISTGLGVNDGAMAGATCIPPSEGALAVAAFHSGWGDGVYPTWLGHAADGSVSVVMTDFLVATDPWSRDPEPTTREPDTAAEPAAAEQPARPRSLWRRLLGRP